MLTAYYQLNGDDEEEQRTAGFEGSIRRVGRYFLALAKLELGFLRSVNAKGTWYTVTDREISMLLLLLLDCFRHGELAKRAKTKPKISFTADETSSIWEARESA